MPVYRTGRHEGGGGHYGYGGLLGYDRRDYGAGGYIGARVGPGPWSLEDPWHGYYTNAGNYRQPLLAYSLQYPGTVVAETALGETTGEYYASGPYPIGFGINNLPLSGSREDPSGARVPIPRGPGSGIVQRRAAQASLVTALLAVLRARAGGARLRATGNPPLAPTERGFKRWARWSGSRPSVRRGFATPGGTYSLTGGRSMAELTLP